MKFIFLDRVFATVCESLKKDSFSNVTYNVVMTSGCPLIFVIGMKSRMAGSQNPGAVCVLLITCPMKSVGRAISVSSCNRVKLFAQLLPVKASQKHLGEDFIFSTNLLLCGNLWMLSEELIFAEFISCKVMRRKKK